MTKKLRYLCELMFVITLAMICVLVGLRHAEWAVGESIILVGMTGTLLLLWRVHYKLSYKRLRRLYENLYWQELRVLSRQMCDPVAHLLAHGSVFDGGELESHQEYYKGAWQILTEESALLTIPFKSHLRQRFQEDYWEKVRLLPPRIAPEPVGQEVA